MKPMISEMESKSGQTQLNTESTEIFGEWETVGQIFNFQLRRPIKEGHWRGVCAKIDFLGSGILPPRT